MSRFEGKVAFITGAGRGQGRSHALRLAEEGADLILVDLGGAGRVATPDYRTATAEDLEKTRADVEALGARVASFEVDIRDADGLVRAAAEGARELGGIDYLLANAGIADGFVHLWDLPIENWQTMIDVNLTGTFYTCRAVVPHIRERGAGGSIVLTSSIAALKYYGWLAHYVASKAGVHALAMVLAKELGPEGIRANSLHPAAIDTDMTDNMVAISGVPKADMLQQFVDAQLIPKVIELRDSTAAALWLLSDEARFVTGHEMVVDGGETKK